MDKIDTSTEAVERVICAPIIRMVDRGGQPTLDGCAAIIDTSRALLAERDTLAAQLAEARNAALEEAATVCEAARDKRNKQRKEKCQGDRDQQQRWMAGAMQASYLSEEIRALKSEPAPMRCAECDCENGGDDCNWIASAHSPESITRRDPKEAITRLQSRYRESLDILNEGSDAPRVSVQEAAKVLHEAWLSGSFEDDADAALQDLLDSGQKFCSHDVMENWFAALRALAQKESE